MNKIFLIGNLTTDVTTGSTQNGVPYSRFGIAVNSRGKNEQTEFFTVTAWRGLADTCASFLSKGKKVSIIGSIQIKTYKSQDGSTKAVGEVTVDDLEFLTPKDSSEKAVLPEVSTDEGDMPF